MLKYPHYTSWMSIFVLYKASANTCACTHTYTDTHTPTHTFTNTLLWLNFKCLLVKVLSLYKEMQAGVKTGKCLHAHKRPFSGVIRKAQCVSRTSILARSADFHLMLQRKFFLYLKIWFKMFKVFFKKQHLSVYSTCDWRFTGCWLIPW